MNDAGHELARSGATHRMALAISDAWTNALQGCLFSVRIALSVAASPVPGFLLSSCNISVSTATGLVCASGTG